MTCHYTHQESASDWLCREGNLLQQIKSATQIWVVTRHQMGFLRSFLERHFDGKPVVASQGNGLGENKNKNSRKYVRGNYRSKWNLKLVDEGDAEKSGEYTKAIGEEAIAREGRPWNKPDYRLNLPITNAVSGWLEQEMTALRES